MARGATFFSTLLLSLLVASVLAAHPGMTDQQGCHTNWATGAYHCHGSRSQDGFGFLGVMVVLVGLFAAFVIVVLAKHYFDVWYETSTEAGRRRATARAARELEERARDAQKAKQSAQWKALQVSREARKRYRPWRRHRRKFAKLD
jgi:hypothetical protein